MADAKLPWQIEKEKEEALAASREQFDPKVHGVGTSPIIAPQSVHEMWDKVVKPLASMVQDLQDRVAYLESKQVSPTE